jgi:hypothetical protein
LTAIAPALATTVITAITALLKGAISTAIIATVVTAFVVITPIVMEAISTAIIATVVTAFVAITPLVTTPIASVLATLITAISQVSRTVIDGTPPPAIRRGTHAGRRVIS